MHYGVLPSVNTGMEGKLQYSRYSAIARQKAQWGWISSISKKIRFMDGPVSTGAARRPQKFVEFVLTKESFYIFALWKLQECQSFSICMESAVRRKIRSLFLGIVVSASSSSYESNSGFADRISGCKKCFRRSKGIYGKFWMTCITYRRFPPTA